VLVEVGLLDVNMAEDQEVLANINIRFTPESGQWSGRSFNN
jgi:hypothetical protein